MRLRRASDSGLARALAVGSFVVNAVACAATGANDPAQCPEASDSAGATDANPGESIPRYFSVELGAEGTLSVDGQRVSDLGKLAELARAAVQSGSVAGAALLVVDGFSPERRHEIVRALVDAGFVHVRFARTPAVRAAASQTAPSTAEPATASPAAPAVVSAPVTTAPPASPAAVSATPKAAPSAPTSTSPPKNLVALKSIGLHIGGATNDDETRAPFLRVLESSFDELRACYADLGGTHRSQSFGVDVFIPKSGAPTKVKEVRTRLGDDTFRTCVVGAFERLEFEAPPRGPTMLSYSVRFDPPTN
jgi:hypothetical protein